MAKDGEERRVEVEAVFVYCEEDLSVGINGGFAFAGLQVGPQRFIDADDIAKWAQREAEELSESDYMDEP